jgi:hypothetical protein
MWGAIKSDLLSFVSTITDDTTKTLNRVLGEDEEAEVRIVYFKVTLGLNFIGNKLFFCFFPIQGTRFFFTG